MWGGVRSNFGIVVPEKETEFPRIAYQCKITEFLPLKHVPFEEIDPHDIRIGWSIYSGTTLLGEGPKSYAITSLGRKATNCVFSKFGDGFLPDDVITTVLDVSNHKIVYYKNGTLVGAAFTEDIFSPGDVVYPHIAIKNCKVMVNFGLELPEPTNADLWK